jgi:glutamyl-tRNA reductase
MVWSGSPQNTMLFADADSIRDELAVVPRGRGSVQGVPVIFAVGLSYKTAPVNVREQLAVVPSQLQAAARQLAAAQRLRELVVLSTCNRVELYGDADEPIDLASLPAALAQATLDVRPHVYVHTGKAAILHLFKVAAGLDSMVLGETEITGQVKKAYADAHAGQLTGPVTNRLFQGALRTAKLIRTQTQIGRGATSVGSVAVELAQKILGQQFGEKTVMIIGAGKMGEACVRHLAKSGTKTVIVANRTLENARALAASIGGEAVDYMERGLEAMRRADVVISSTGCPVNILDKEDLEFVMRGREERPLVLVDIAVPRDVSPAARDIPGVHLYNVDDLEGVVQENVRLRQAELETCERLAAEQAARVFAKVTSDNTRELCLAEWTG